jgi:uncharacterized protein YcbK (DUF882 family)
MLILRWIGVACLIPLLGSCISPAVKTQRTPVKAQPQPAQPLTVKKQTPDGQLQLQQSIRWQRSAPDSYNRWLKDGNHQDQVNRYNNYLVRHDAHRAAPMFELLRSARDWERCGREPYAVPPTELWENLLPTLKVLQKLRDTKILDDLEVTSVYRDPDLNACANGSAGSKHVHNAALDFRIGSENPEIGDLEQIAEAKHKLCIFWQANGERLNLGLGLYASGQIHIDTQGFRTWGPDHTRGSSICPSY